MPIAVEVSAVELPGFSTRLHVCCIMGDCSSRTRTLTRARLVGWLLMLLLAEIVQHFGRVSLMATITALATRIIRQSGAWYMWVVGLGYAFGGFTFDLLFFLPPTLRLTGRRR